MVPQTEQEDVVVVGWLRGDDYEAALAYRRREEPTQPDDPPNPPPPAEPAH
jgi:hypothetical protein